MAIVEQFLPKKDDWYPIDRLERQLKDYINVSENLIWQRQAIFLAATLLAAFYFSPVVSFSSYAAVLFTEVLDLILARNVNRWTDHDPAKARKFLWWVMVNTVASAVAISLFVILITLQQTSGGHFTPLFFLFAASLFAAVNNHQLLPALFLRLSVYGATFVFIATWDIIRLNPPIDSDVWLQFFTVAFVMYFIVDCSFVFLKLYRRGLAQIEEITLEHEKTKAALEMLRLRSSRSFCRQSATNCARRSRRSRARLIWSTVASWGRSPIRCNPFLVSPPRTASAWPI
jgi:hypothetical protein